MKIELGQPVVVAQGDKERYPWGIWQFPLIRSLKPGQFYVTFSQTPDTTWSSATEYNPNAAFASEDGGKTWDPIDTKGTYGIQEYCTHQNGNLLYLEPPPCQDIPKSKLPEPAGQCDNGYQGVWTTRDPLKMPKGVGQWHLLRRLAGKDKWERIPAVINDCDGAIVGHDPPGKDYAILFWLWHVPRMVELPDASLLAVFYGYRLGPDRKPHPKYESWCLRSTDGGVTWKFHGIIARDDNHPLAGYTEPRTIVLSDGSLLGMLRTECFKTGPMLQTRSTDGGKTWGKPTQIYPFGVLPRLCPLENGVLALSFGRPGVHMLFSIYGRGEKWENRTTFVAESFEGTGIAGEGYGYQKGELPDGRPKQTRTSGYTDIIATGPDSLLIAYDQFDYPNENGEPRKTILVRSVRVSR